MRPNAISDFWSNVDIRGDDECWPWKLSKGRGGYGRFKFKGKFWYTNRLAFELEKGPLGEDMEACHTCDNPPCCNPAHLFEGTHLDNMMDRAMKGRTSRKSRNRGADNKSSKLTPALVLQLREDRKSGSATLKVLAEKYGVAESTVCEVLKGKKWRHV